MSKCKGYFFIFYFDLVGTVSTTHTIETFLFSVSKTDIFFSTITQKP